MKNKISLGWKPPASTILLPVFLNYLLVIYGVVSRGMFGEIFY